MSARAIGRTLAAGVLAGSAMLAVGAGGGAAAACDELAIPSLQLTRCVVPGDQAQIDQGNVVRVDGLSSEHLDWLAGHRTSHGGTFRALPTLTIGATLGWRGRAWEIVEYAHFDRLDPSVGVLAWLQVVEPTLVLQTSASGTFAHAFRAIPLDAPPPIPDPPAPPAPATVAAPPAVGGRVKPSVWNGAISAIAAMSAGGAPKRPVPGDPAAPVVRWSSVASELRARR